MPLTEINVSVMLSHNNASEGFNVLKVLMFKQCLNANWKQFSHYFSYPFTAKFEHWLA